MFTVEELGQEIAELAVHLDAATHRMLECIRQFDAECGWEPQGAVSCAHWLSWRIGLDPATAREKVRVARALGNLPAIDAALKSGKLSYAKVRALTRVATPEAEAKLLEVALYSTGAQLERLCRGYRIAMTADNVLPPPERSVRRRELSGGMVKLEVVLLPDEAALVLSALDRAREVGHEASKPDVSAERRKRDWAHAKASKDDSATETPWPSRADGVVALAESYLAGNVGRGSGGERFQVMLHIDQDPLAPDHILAGTLDDGTRVSAESIRRVACDCGIVAIPPVASPRPAQPGELPSPPAAPADASPRPAQPGELPSPPTAPADASPCPAQPGELPSPPAAPAAYSPRPAQRKEFHSPPAAPADESPRPAQRGEVDARTQRSVGEGLPGRRSRTIPPSLRRALILRDRGCAFPGCTHNRFLHGHHIRHWLHGGATSLENLALLCSHHHHLVHEGGWSVVRTSEGEMRVRAPNGREMPAVPAREASEDALAFLQEWAEDRGMDIGADTNTPLWDGTRLDYDWAVAVLASEAGV